MYSKSLKDSLLGIDDMEDDQLMLDEQQLPSITGNSSETKALFSSFNV